MFKFWKQRYLHMGKTVTESFFEYHAKKCDFSPTESLFVLLDDNI